MRLRLPVIRDELNPEKSLTMARMHASASVSYEVPVTNLATHAGDQEATSPGAGAQRNIYRNMMDVPKDSGGYSLPISDPRFGESMASPQYDVPDYSMLPDSFYEGEDDPMAMAMASPQCDAPDYSMLPDSFYEGGDDPKASPQYDAPDFSMLPDSLHEGGDGTVAKKNSIYVSEEFIFISGVQYLFC